MIAATNSDDSNTISALQIKIENLVTAMGGVLQTKASSDVNFVIVKNVVSAKYKVYCLDVVLSLIYIYFLLLVYFG